MTETTSGTYMVRGWVCSTSADIDCRIWDLPEVVDHSHYFMWEDLVSGNAMVLMNTQSMRQCRLLWRSRSGRIRDMSSFAARLADREAVVAAVNAALVGGRLHELH